MKKFLFLLFLSFNVNALSLHEVDIADVECTVGSFATRTFKDVEIKYRQNNTEQARYELKLKDGRRVFVPVNSCIVWFKERPYQ